MDSSMHISKSILVARDADTLYSYWRDLENLPRFMSHLEYVIVKSPLESHWIAKGPAGVNIEWDAEIAEDISNELIRWRSKPDSEIPNEGFVRFTPRAEGTEIHLELRYDPPAGKVGAFFARLFGADPARMVEQDLENFKALVESEGIGHLRSWHGGPAET